MIKPDGSIYADAVRSPVGGILYKCIDGEFGERIGLSSGSENLNEC